jgi:hypothetical protein
LKRHCAPLLTVVCVVATVAFAAIATTPQVWAQPASSAPVPFVGCAADGQMGPVPAPSASSSAPLVPTPVAPKLAYYASTHLGVLAPRGWHCFGLYGSSGSTLIVTPEQHDATDLLRPNTKLRGPAVELSRIMGGTSGRFEVAKISARVFPVAKAFVQQVIDEGLVPKSEFPSGSYPSDTLNRRSDTEVEFVTPADTDGIGTSNRISKNGEAIHGVAILLPEEDMDLVLLSARLPSSIQNSAPTIIKAVEANPSFLDSK